ncbi:serine hydrolase domain-containing protein [Kribbella kalugense]|uniref:CubicO group peptidase (Beta-lactamase class C family) n=1 Tax=Kribbella kalugense TaxID=2512221 RepID=A0A4R7ZWC0_9ACTN|nr:serine hydrolase domain-containing protein [Kribbella kalugense]TDW22393.1 CubicO group peptidase (beta-lactamase class C family) [Kribbella kalugense]
MSLLPRSTPAAQGMSSRAIAALLDRIAAESVELHSIMVVRRGHVVAEGWWAPYSPERPHLLYSLTKSFTSIAVGLVIADGLLSLDALVVDVLPEHVPADISEQGRRITVHHLLSMTSGHTTDSLEEAWQLEPNDLVKGFLRVPFREPEGTHHTYDNATTFVLARMVERVTGRGLPELLDERLFKPMGIDHAEWDRVASGAAFGFHGLHLTTEAVAAFGELLLRGGVWGDQQFIPRAWVELATSRHIETLPLDDWARSPDFLSGYGYQFWMSRHGYHGNGAFGQQCVVVPSHELVIVVTAAIAEGNAFPGVFWDYLLSDLDDAEYDEILADRLRRLSLPLVEGAANPTRSVEATLDSSPENSALPDGTPVIVDPVDGGWQLQFEAFTLKVGYGEWRESSPRGRPVVATGAWQGDTFLADLYIITTPHRVQVVVDAGRATVTWSTVPLTGPNLALHLQSPLMTRPDVA